MTTKTKIRSFLRAILPQDTTLQEFDQAFNHMCEVVTTIQGRIDRKYSLIDEQRATITRLKLAHIELKMLNPDPPTRDICTAGNVVKIVCPTAGTYEPATIMGGNAADPKQAVEVHFYSGFITTFPEQFIRDNAVLIMEGTL